jgi:serine/threonine protein kinase
MSGEGGQGAVYEVSSGKLAVKLLRNSTTPQREHLRNQIARVRLLDLKDIDVARPLELLRPPELGYVMELLTGMVPLKRLAFVPPTEKSPVEWYLRTGGLRRRLMLLARTANLLKRLHSKGLVYSDPSPDNIFVSAALEDYQVRLIDADNLHYASAPGDHSLYTPTYGAPELVDGRSGVNTLTDAHAFAVIAFITLALVHPLIGGALVANGPPEKEEEALSGHLPWIDDLKDHRNRAVAGIAREKVLSSRLAELFERAFTDGLKEPQQRPGMSDWAERLALAAGFTIRCEHCDATFYYNAPACVWCEEKAPKHVVAVVRLWDPEEGKVVQQPGEGKAKPLVVAGASLTEGDPLVITAEMAGLHGHCPACEAICDITLESTGLVVRASGTVPLRVVSVDGKSEKDLTTAPMSIPFRDNDALWELRFGKNDVMHRIMRFVLKEGT